MNAKLREYRPHRGPSRRHITAGYAVAAVLVLGLAVTAGVAWLVPSTRGWFAGGAALVLAWRFKEPIAFVLAALGRR